MPRRNIPAPVPEGWKWCFQCSTAQPRQRFEVDRRAPDGHRHNCRRCRDAQIRRSARTKRMMTETYLRLTIPSES